MCNSKMGMLPKCFVFLPLSKTRFQNWSPVIKIRIPRCTGEVGKLPWFQVRSHVPPMCTPAAFRRGYCVAQAVQAQHNTSSLSRQVTLFRTALPVDGGRPALSRRRPNYAGICSHSRARPCLPFSYASSLAKRLFSLCLPAPAQRMRAPARRARSPTTRPVALQPPRRGEAGSASRGASGPERVSLPALHHGGPAAAWARGSSRLGPHPSHFARTRMGRGERRQNMAAGHIRAGTGPTAGRGYVRTGGPGRSTRM